MGPRRTDPANANGESWTSDGCFRGRDCCCGCGCGCGWGCANGCACGACAWRTTTSGGRRRLCCHRRRSCACCSRPRSRRLMRLPRPPRPPTRQRRRRRRRWPHRCHGCGWVRSNPRRNGALGHFLSVRVGIKQFPRRAPLELVEKAVPRRCGRLKLAENVRDVLLKPVQSAPDRPRIHVSPAPRT